MLISRRFRGENTVAIPATDWREALYWACRQRRRVRVSGRSMAPLLAHGDEVLLDPKRPLQIGAVVVARHPFRGGIFIVKRLTERDEQGGLTLLGDNPAESTDSRSLGRFRLDQIVGTVTSRLPRRMVEQPTQSTKPTQSTQS